MERGVEATVHNLRTGKIKLKYSAVLALNGK
jgi:hypothetical protein